MLDTLEWEVGIVEDRITPLVEPDPFREQLGAQPVGDTIDPVHAQSHCPL
jgi:hypothetical protein